MTTRPLMLALAISATLLAGCKQQAASSPAAGGADSTAVRRRVACVEWPECRTGKTVMACEFDGQHGNWMADNLLEDAFAWFVQRQQQ